jgi:hypothetical protein
MSRRLILIIIIIAIILFASLIAYFIYSFFAQKAPAPVATSTTAGFIPPSAGQNQTLPSRISLVSQNPVVDYYQNSDGSVALIQPSGEITLIGASGQETSLSKPLSSNIIDAKFSSDGKKALIKIGTFNFSLFDVASSTMTPLDYLGKIEDAAFSPASSSQIAYLQNNGSYSNLNLTNFGGAKIQTQNLATFAEQDYQMSWPNTNMISLVQKPSSYFPGNLILFNVSAKSASLSIYGLTGLMINWLPNNLGLEFYSNINNRGGNFYLINNSGSQLNRFNIFTLPSKCAFDTNSSSTLYCAVPRDANFTNQTLPDDYLMHSIYTNDNIYKIDLSGNQIELYFNDPLENYDMSNIKIFGNTFYFINRYDQKLYKMTLS